MQLRGILAEVNAQQTVTTNPAVPTFTELTTVHLTTYMDSPVVLLRSFSKRNYTVHLITAGTKPA